MSVSIVPADGVSVLQEQLIPYAMELNVYGDAGEAEGESGKVELLRVSPLPFSPNDEPSDERQQNGFWSTSVFQSTHKSPLGQSQTRRHKK